MIQESPEEVPRHSRKTLARPALALPGSPTAPAEGGHTWAPSPARPTGRGGRWGRGGEGPAGRTAKWSRGDRDAARASLPPPDGGRRAKRRWGAPQGRKEEPTTKRRLLVNKIAARWAGGPNGSSQWRREQEVPRASLSSSQVSSPGRDPETPVWLRPGLVPPSTLPQKHTPSGEDEGSRDLGPAAWGRLRRPYLTEAAAASRPSWGAERGTTGDRQP